MIELFAVYQYAFLLCLVAGVLLSFLGAHLVTRKESLQVLALAQAALVGNLVGRLAFSEKLQEIGVLVFSLIFFIIFKLLFIYSKRIMRSSKETFFVVTYLSLISISYLLISIFPGLEGHMAVSFFGDIVSLPVERSIVITIILFVLLIIMLLMRRRLLRGSFEKAVLGSKKIELSEELLFALIFVISLYSFGFLFTVSTIIFPTVLIGSKGRSLGQIITIMLIVTGVSSMLGLGGSIWLERLSTVPTQVLTLLVFLVVIGLVLQTQRNKRSD